MSFKITKLCGAGLTILIRGKHLVIKALFFYYSLDRHDVGALFGCKHSNLLVILLNPHEHKITSVDNEQLHLSRV